MIRCRRFCTDTGKKLVCVTLFDNGKRIPQKTKDAAEVIKRLNSENKLLFGPLLRTKQQRVVDEQIGIELSYLSAPIPKRLVPKNGNRAPKLEKLIAKHYGYKDVGTTGKEYADAVFQQSQLSTNTNVSSAQNDLGIPKKISDKTATMNFPLFNYNKEDKPVNNGVLLPTYESLTTDGRHLPSVSKILQDTMDAKSKAALEIWRQKMISKLGLDGFNAYQEAMFEQGRNLHKSIETVLSGTATLDTVPIEKANEGHWQSLHSYLSRMPERAELLESQVVHPFLRYRGIVDCVVVVDGKMRLVEWKTSKRSKSNIDSTFDNPIQAVAYMGALNYDPKYNIQVDSASVVIAYEDGSPCDVHTLNAKAAQVYWNAWLKRVRLFWQNSNQSSKL